MSWIDDDAQLECLKSELSSCKAYEMIGNGRFEQLLECGLYADCFVQSLVKDLIRNYYSLMPVLVASPEELTDLEFLEFLSDLELFCEKIRHVENIEFELLIMDNEKSSSWKTARPVPRSSRDRFYHDHFLRCDFDVSVKFYSPYVGEWLFSVCNDPKLNDTHSDKKFHEGFSSARECLHEILDVVT